MLIRLGLVALALLSVTLAFAGGADADSRWKHRYYTYDPDYDFYYGPEYLPQPRYYRYLRLSVAPVSMKTTMATEGYEPDYYEPEYIPPRKKRKSVARSQIEEKSRTQAVEEADLDHLHKAGEIVSGYGFKSVEQVSCKGQVYAFNATRDGKPFSVKLSAASGELTEVRKLK